MLPGIAYYLSLWYQACRAHLQALAVHGHGAPSRRVRRSPGLPHLLLNNFGSLRSGV